MNLWSDPRVNWNLSLSLFPESSSALSQEPKPQEMPEHHCHRDPLPPPGLSPERLRAQKQLCAACAVCCVFMAGEVVGKWRAVPSASPHSVPGGSQKEEQRGA